MGSGEEKAKKEETSKKFFLDVGFRIMTEYLNAK